MGCAASAPQDVDTLPIKAHCRTAFSRCSTTERANGQITERFPPNPEEEGHDVVLCYPLGGTVFGLELQARYEKMESVSLWTMDHFHSVPGTPIGLSKSMSGGIHSSRNPESALEIKPAPEVAEAAVSANVALSREIRMCRRGVVVLVTAGCTWDDGVLSCLRLTGRFLRPLVMVHCVQSCPLPALEEWPLDVRPLIAASGPPIKYLTQHSTEALRGVEQRMMAAAEALVATATASESANAIASRENTDQAQQQKVRQQEGGTPMKQQRPQPHQQAQRRPEAQQQQATVVSLNCSCLDDAMWASPVQSRPLPPQPPQQQELQQQPSSQQTDGTAGSSASSASDQPLGTASDASDTTGSRLIPSPSKLSLAALQAADSEVCRRAAQLLGLLTYGRSQSACTAVEARVQEQHVRAAAASGDCSPGARCVLHHRDLGWATAVAFVCAQLEAELGRSNVSLQMAIATGGAMSGTATRTSVRLSLQSMNSGGDYSQKSILHEHHQQHHLQAVPTTAAVAGAAAAAAAASVALITASSLNSSQRSSSPSGSSRCCSASGGPRTDAVSGSTSRRTSGIASLSIARADEELEPFARPSVDGCSMPLHTASTSRRSCSDSAPRPNPGGGLSAQPDTRSISWGEDAELRRDDVQDGRGAASASSVSPAPSDAECLVYFMTPGLSTSLGCLAEVAAGLAQGRRILLVVDGECCQRLPDFVPAGMTPEMWKTIKRLWHERLLYVADYHASFCTLLKQGIVAAVAASAAPTTAQS